MKFEYTSSDKKEETIVNLVVSVISLIVATFIALINGIISGFNNNAAAQSPAAQSPAASSPTGTAIVDHAEAVAGTPPNSEQNVILRMLAEKKITAEEANRLLSALEGRG